MHAEDIQRLNSLEGVNKFNVKVVAVDELLQSIYTQLNKTEVDVGKMQEDGYSDEENNKLMAILKTLRKIESVTRGLGQL